MNKEFILKYELSERLVNWHVAHIPPEAENRIVICHSVTFN